MTKMKTKKIVAKRFKLTGGGKLVHRSQGMRHLRSKKNKSRQRRQDKPHTLINARSIRMIKQFLSH